MHMDGRKWSKEVHSVVFDSFYDYPDYISENNPNEVPLILHGLQLKFHLFDCAADLIKDIPWEFFKSDNCFVAIDEVLYKHNLLSAPTDVFPDFTTHFNTLL